MDKYRNDVVYFKAKDGSEHPDMESVRQANEMWFRIMYPEKVETIIQNN